MNRDVLGHSHDEGNLRLDGFFNCLGRLVPWNVDGRCVRFCLFLGLFEPVPELVSHAFPSQRQEIRTVFTEGNTGRPKCSPSTPGLTPPTILVPHANDSLTLAVAWSIG